MKRVKIYSYKRWNRDNRMKMFNWMYCMLMGHTFREYQNHLHITVVDKTFCIRCQECFY